LKLIKAKAETIFKLFDFENRIILKREELLVLFRTCICSLQAMCGKKSYPSILEIEKKLESILRRYDMQDLQQISLVEFQTLISKDQEILQLLKSFNFITSDDLREVMETEKETVECDSDIDAEILTKSRFEKGEGDSEIIKGDPGFKAAKKRELNIEINAKQIWDKRLQPVKYTEDTLKKEHLPNIEVEPKCIFGPRSIDVRKSTRISPNGDIVFFSGKAAIVLDRNTNNEKLFQHHSKPISCMASFESHFATGEYGEDPCIQIWDYKTFQKKSTLQGHLPKGVSHLAFSHDGKKLAALAIDETHTVVVYDFAKILNGRISEDQDLIFAVYQGPQKVR
jgi:hypothetical protein